MKKTPIAIALAFAAVTAHAQDQQAMMEAFQKAATPGPNHKLLESVVGDWTYSMKMWMDPSAPPQESTGTTTYKSIMGGRYIQHDHKGSFMGMPFEGMGLEAYDNVSKQFVASWIDNMSTSLLLFTGSYDAATKTFTFKGEMDDPMKPGTKVKVRQTVKLVDANNHVMQWFETRAAKETKAMEIAYKRK